MALVSKTPEFDALLDAVLVELVPHTRTCLWRGEHEHCEDTFQIESEDIEFLKMLRVPPPTYCPTCRRMRRLVHMNLTRFFKRACNAPGHSEQIISIFPPDCPFPVYDYQYQISDAFDAHVFAKEYVKGESPLDQFFALRKEVPMPSFLNRDPSSINSEYSNGGRESKNCYYATGSFNSENVWYAGLSFKSKDVMDCRDISYSDTVYGALSSDHLYKSSLIYFSKDCSDSILLFDCKNCTNCFGCVNLRNKRYCVFNEQKTKEEYEAFIAALMPISYSELESHKKQFWTLVRSLPVNASRNVSTQNVVGTLVENSRNLYQVTESDKSEHLRYCDGVLSHKDSMDVLFSGGNSEMQYQSTNNGSDSTKMKFSVSSKYTTESEFLLNCKNISNCFMCIGLYDKSYCILNKQYSPEEYWKLLDEIKTDMFKLGEYGECVDMKFSAQAYNFSLGGIYYPLASETIVALGGYVGKEPDIDAGNLELIKAQDLPDRITEVGDSILNQAIVCEKTGRPFRIISTELSFLRRIGMPLPRSHPSVRLENYYAWTPLGLNYPVQCENCGKSILSIYNPNDGYVLYCENCYQKEVV
jgi:hypothetical protein